MFTLLLRQDIARARALELNLHHGGRALRGALVLGKLQALNFIGTPAGLLTSFAAGFLTGMVTRRPPKRLIEILKGLAKPLIADALIRLAAD